MPPLDHSPLDHSLLVEGGWDPVVLAWEEGDLRLLNGRRVAALRDAILQARLVLCRVRGGALRDAGRERAPRAWRGQRRRGGAGGCANLAVADIGEEAVGIAVDPGWG